MSRIIDYQIVLYHFGNGRVNEAVVPNEDMSYTIFINDDLSPEGRYRAFLHALDHIQNEDFHGTDVQDIEQRAHGGNLYEG